MSGISMVTIRPRLAWVMKIATATTSYAFTFEIPIESISKRRMKPPVHLSWSMVFAKSGLPGQNGVLKFFCEGKHITNHNLMHTLIFIYFFLLVTFSPFISYLQRLNYCYWPKFFQMLATCLHINFHSLMFLIFRLCCTHVDSGHNASVW